MSTITSINEPAVQGRRSAAQAIETAAPVSEADTAVTSASATRPNAVVIPPEPAAATTVSFKPSALRRVAGKVVKGIGVGMLVLAAMVFLFLAIGPRVFGYQTSTMLTGSMAPLINPGDVVVTVPTPVADIKVGDVITYHIPVEDQRVETHRITEITTTADGGVAVQTKGDANNGIDPWIATLQGKTVDKQIATIPYVGNAIRALREPIVMNTLMYGAPAILVIGMLASIWTKEPTKSAPEDAAAAQAASGE
ncbi:signal peptidase I [Paenarthrobacter nitroguajacolicus]|uniref:signal peptidase I n=1 Tax=Paenarthrobacter nitroguajacolicus TaxID=211146 RepID=UPI0015BC81E6|nr:signal peptidase I [Paenarthrobacter nitroguajacolicus]NWL12930.1 signal peptidase I [Paenarthrobacter nitroguajacolicus]NWL33581.1 signal peptidase I [Paenarthrobacter nitroguajacolicus]